MNEILLISLRDTLHVAIRITKADLIKKRKDII